MWQYHFSPLAKVKRGPNVLMTENILLSFGSLWVSWGKLGDVCKGRLSLSLEIGILLASAGIKESLVVPFR